MLFIGDIVGQPGRNAVKALLPSLRSRHAIDVVVANGENSAGGSGITPKTAEEIFAAGVDVITSGDHLWDQKEVMGLLEDEPRFLRPMNYPQEVPGRGSGVFEIKNPGAKFQGSVGIMNFQGRTFMQPAVDNPFLLALDEVKKLRERTKIIFVDFPCGGDLGKDCLRANVGRPGERGSGHTHACANGRRADFSWRHGIFERCGVHRAA